MIMLAFSLPGMRASTAFGSRAGLAEKVEVLVVSVSRAGSRVAKWSLIGLGATAFLAGCSTGDQGAVTGVSVTVNNATGVPIHVFGCVVCTSQGLGVVGNPDHKPSSPGQGAAISWTEERTWPVTYTVTLRGARIACPTVMEPPGMRLISVTYSVTDNGKCLVLDKGVSL